MLEILPNILAAERVGYNFYESAVMAIAAAAIVVAIACYVQLLRRGEVALGLPSLLVVCGVIVVVLILGVIGPVSHRDNRQYDVYRDEARVLLEDHIEADNLDYKVDLVIPFDATRGDFTIVGYPSACHASYEFRNGEVNTFIRQDVEEDVPWDDAPRQSFDNSAELDHTDDCRPEN